MSCSGDCSASDLSTFRLGETLDGNHWSHVRYRPGQQIPLSVRQLGFLDVIALGHDDDGRSGRGMVGVSWVATGV